MKLFKIILTSVLLTLSLTAVANSFVVYSIDSAGDNGGGYSWWNLSYTVTNNAPLLTINELNIYFVASLYPYLTPVPEVKPGWNTTGYDYATTSDVPYPENTSVPYAYYYYNANTTGAGISPNGGVATFSLKIAYQGLSGEEAPQLQVYESFYNDGAHLTLVDSGITEQTSAVPEPTTVVLLGLSLGVIALARRRMSQRQENRVFLTKKEGIL